MRDRLLDELPKRVPDTIVTGPLDRARRLPNSASFAFEHVEGEAVLLQLDLQGIAASSGSACTTASLEPSHVLTAMDVPESYLRGSLRLTLGTDNTMADIDRCSKCCRQPSPASARSSPPPAASSDRRDDARRAPRGRRAAQEDPRILAMIEEARDPANGADVVRWEDLKRKHAGR